MSTTIINTSLADKVADAVLYEGYILYPYRASSRKNRERFTFGRVYPAAYSQAQDGAEPCIMQTQCLARIETGDGRRPVLHGHVRFLQAMARDICEARPGSDPDTSPVVAELRAGGEIFQTWLEAVEREVLLPEVSLQAPSSRAVKFSWESTRSVEPLRGDDGEVVGFARRRQRGMQGEISITVEPGCEHVAKITVRIRNLTPMSQEDLASQPAVVLATFASTHTIIEVDDGEFVSLIDPPAECALAVTSCENIGTWPVLVGDEHAHECKTMLSSPIILYDYPKIAPESPGNLCDGLEIDEILTLRMLTLTDDEKAEMRGVDEYARRMLERTEALGPEDLMRLHGVMRESPAFFDGNNTRLTDVMVGGVPMQAGDRVRIRPKNRADAMDMMISGKIGVIEAIEQDAEGKVHLAIVLEDDPGRDLGMMRQPGHRFFYALDEVEPAEELEEE